MRILAFAIGITIAAVFVTAFAAADHNAPKTEAPIAPPAQSVPVDAQAGPMHLAAAAAGLMAILVVAPLAGKL